MGKRIRAEELKLLISFALVKCAWYFRRKNTRPKDAKSFEETSSQPWQEAKLLANPQSKHIYQPGIASTKKIFNMKRSMKYPSASLPPATKWNDRQHIKINSVDLCRWPWNGWKTHINALRSVELLYSSVIEGGKCMNF